MRTSGFNAFGLSVLPGRNGNTITNAGLVSTTGARGHGLDARGSNSTIINQGTVNVSGAGASGTAFLANADYRQYLFEHLQANTFEMETAALAHVAYANSVPYIAFRSLSDLAGAQEFNAEVAALFTSGLAEANEAAVTLAFLDAWKARSTKLVKPVKPAEAAR